MQVPVFSVPSAPPKRGASQVRVIRSLPFLELIELLEFSRLRLDPPPAQALKSPDALLGTQDWLCAASAVPLPPTQDFEVYVCSTLSALETAVLPPDDTRLHVDPPVAAAHEASVSRLRLCATGPQRKRKRRALPHVRVDIAALIQRVMVPATVPNHVFELIQQVVRTRLWVDVARA